VLLDDQKGLLPLEVEYATGIAPNALGKPFWVAEGQASVGRETYSGNQAREAQDFWGQPRRFFVPAFTSSLENLLSLGTNLLLNPPAFQLRSEEGGPPARFEPVTLHAEDVTAAAEFIIVAIEAGRRDKLKRIDLSLKLSTPCLWILP
jgi:hypothetical protein